MHREKRPGFRPVDRETRTLTTFRPIAVWPLVALSALLLLGACSRTGGSGDSSEANTMEMNAMTTAHRGALPPIDAAVPQNVDTATFGLG